MPESKRHWRERLRNARASMLVAGLILVALGGIAAWLSGETARDGLRMGAYFIGGIVVSLLALSAVAWILLRSLQSFLRGAAGERLPANLRHGMANLYRPGNQAQTVLVALGLGVMFSLTIPPCTARPNSRPCLRPGPRNGAGAQTLQTPDKKEHLI